MAKIVRLTESNLVDLIKRVINEDINNDRILNIASMIASSQFRNIPTRVIINSNSKYNNVNLQDYFSQQKVTQQELIQAKNILKKMGVKDIGDQSVQNQLLASMERNKNQQTPLSKNTQSLPKSSATTSAPATTPASTTTPAPATPIQNNPPG